MIKYSQMTNLEIYEMFDQPLLFTTSYEGKIYMFYYLQCVRKPSPNGFVRGVEYISFEVKEKDVHDFEENKRSLLSILLSALQDRKVYKDRVYYDEDNLHEGEPLTLKELEQSVLLEKTDTLEMLNFYRNELSL